MQALKGDDDTGYRGPAAVVQDTYQHTGHTKYRIARRLNLMPHVQVGMFTHQHHDTTNVQQERPFIPSSYQVHPYGHLSF